METKGSVAAFSKVKPVIQKSSFQTRRIAPQVQQIDDFHPADTLVMSQISDCYSCPGREQEIKKLLEIRDGLEVEVADSWDKSALHRIDGKLALCSSCGQQEKPRVLIKSA